MSAEQTLASQGYSNVSRLGQGAFGDVFSCTDIYNASVAVKVSFDASGRVAAQREAEMMTAIPQHKNVLSIVSFTSTSEYTLTALPLATGDTLKLMQERGCTPLPEAETRNFFSQLVDAVDHMHSNGFVHRDIKCENILLTGARRRDILLADFGFAARAPPGVFLTEAWGSLHYSAPEICARIAYDGTKIDIWSMGIVLFAWATGRLPFGGNTDDETSARIVAGLYSISNAVSPALADLIHHMLQVEPTRRITIEEIRKHEWMLVTPAIVSLPRSTSNVFATRPSVSQKKERRYSINISTPARLLKSLFRQHH